MKIIPPVTESRAELSVVPLVNVVFLLLVFFMLVGQVVSPEPLPVEPPRSVSGEAGGGQAVKILVTRDGRVAIDQDVVPVSSLEERVARILDQRPTVSFQIKADARAEGVAVIRIMERLQAAGVERLTLLTERRRSGG